MLDVLKPTLVVFGLSLVASSASASIPDANGVIHGCYNVLSGSTRIIDGTSCGLLEKHVAWSQKGPAGASVTGESLNQGDAHCPAGGVALTLSGTTSYICNGPQGPQGPEGPQGPQGVGGVSMGFGMLTLDPPANATGDSGPATENFDTSEKFYATKLARCMVHLNAWLWWRGSEVPASFRINIAPARSTQPGMLIGDGSPISLTPEPGTRQGAHTSWFWVNPGSEVSFGASARTMEGTVPSNASTMVYVHWICQNVEDDPNYAKNHNL